MVEIESGLTGSSFEAWLGRCVRGDVGGEMKITSWSVDTAGLEGRNSVSGLGGPKGRKLESRSEKIAKMLSAEEQSSVGPVMESDGSGFFDSN